MQLNSAALIYFSPTGTTRRIIGRIAQGLELKTTTDLDLTLRPPFMAGVENDIALIGAPVYGGRIPPLAAQRLQGIKGQGRPAAVVVVYGNRAYEDALLELKDLTEANGYKVIAAGAFIGEHSYTDDSHPIALGRPDAADLEETEAFGKRIAIKMAAINTHSAAETLVVPGHHPYKDQRRPLGESPITREDLCTLCGTCAEVCPTGVITVDDQAVTTEQSGCIACCACIKSCPTQARIYTANHIAGTRQFLIENHSSRKAPELFI